MSVANTRNDIYFPSKHSESHHDIRNNAGKLAKQVIRGPFSETEAVLTFPRNRLIISYKYVGKRNSAHFRGIEDTYSLSQAYSRACIPGHGLEHLFHTVAQEHRFGVTLKFFPLICKQFHDIFIVLQNKENCKPRQV